MGAKICRLLDSIDPSPSSVFRNLLCYKMDYQQKELFQFMANESHKVRGTALFLAELYIQLQNVNREMILCYDHYIGRQYIILHLNICFRMVHVWYQSRNIFWAH